MKLLFDVVDGSLRVSASLSLYGNDVLQREDILDRGADKSFVDRSNRLVSGFLSRYYLYVNATARPSVTRIQIWRPSGDTGTTNCTLVWQRRVFLNTSRHGLLYTVIRPTFIDYHRRRRRHFRLRNVDTLYKS